MPAPNLNDPEQRAAYRAELRGVARPLRMMALAVTLVGVGLAALARMGQIPVWVPLLVIATGGVMTLVGTVQRNSYHRRRMQGR